MYGLVESIFVIDISPCNAGNEEYIYIKKMIFKVHCFSVGRGSK